MNKSSLCLCAFVFHSFTTPLSAGEAYTLSRLQAYLCLPDHQLAVMEADYALSQYPSSKKITHAALKIYAKSGAEEKVLKLIETYEDKQLPRDCLEEIAWGVIEKGSESSLALVRAISLIAASIGDDARGVRLLARHVSDPHRAVRGLAIEFSSHFRDAPLQEAILERLKKEQDVEVRVALLSAVGSMKIDLAENDLLAVLENDKTTAEEKAAAIASLAELKETIEEKEIAKFLASPRACMRVAGAKLVQSNDKKQDCHLLLPLLADTCREVRKAALEVLGTFKVPISDVSLLGDSDPSVAITAAWVFTLNGCPLGPEALSKWLESSNQQERILAAGALAQTGKYGFPLTLQAFRKSEDPYVRVNLAHALVCHGIEEEEGLTSLYEMVMNHPEKVMTKKLGCFEVIAPSDARHKAEIANYPEALNQATRLKLLNLLAIKEYPGAANAATHFLKERPWGVTGAASALLLTEGDEEALVLIRALLDDPSDKVQLQAALLLAAWGNDPEALNVLQRLYPKALKAQKEHIVEAIGRTCDLAALPFLLKCLEEPHQTLRMIAASSILQILYH